MGLFDTIDDKSNVKKEEWFSDLEVSKIVKRGDYIIRLGSKYHYNRIIESNRTQEVGIKQA